MKNTRSPNFWLVLLWAFIAALSVSALLAQWMFIPTQASASKNVAMVEQPAKHKAKYKIRQLWRNGYVSEYTYETDRFYIGAHMPGFVKFTTTDGREMTLSGDLIIEEQGQKQ